VIQTIKKGRNMTERDFCFWLRGFFELTGKQDISKEQAEMINAHLDYVFEEMNKKVEPPVFSSTTTSILESLSPKATIC
jgi:hypothetical protein